MDFRRPGEHPVEDQNHHFDGTDGTMPPVQAPAHFPQPKRSKGHVLLTTIMSILVFGLAAYGVYAYLSEQQLRQRESDLTARVNSLEGQLQTINKKVEEAEKKPDQATQDKEAIIAVVTANLKAPVSSKDKKVVVAITKQGTEFALASGGFENSEGIAHILKKVDGTWTVIFSGQGKVSQTDVTAYAIPADYIPQAAE